MLQLLRMRLFDGNGMPVESTVALTQDLFKYAGELMAMSIIQGGPAPNYLSPVVFDVIFKGLCSANLSLDMIDNTQFNEIASKVQYKIYNADFDWLCLVFSIIIFLRRYF